MSIQQLKAQSLVPAVPKRESVSRGWFGALFAWWARPPSVPDHLRDDVGLPPRSPSPIMDFPLIDLGRSDRSRKNDWMN